ncbi:hypothetical protein DER45DRAFT_599364 [Fusarium avenaceum]|nr:hypothetical protein DER45DRAFT_599364 [Fusarium avenaceum]
MADQHDETKLNGPKIATFANECLESFQKCLSSAASIHPREVSMIEDQAARFSTWASGIGVFAQENIAMDYRLRYVPDVTGIVTGLLATLNYRCQICLEALESILESGEKNSHATTNVVFQQTLLDIAAEISRLNKISNTIRRASQHTQVLRAGDFRINDDEGNDVEPLLLSHFARLIADRFPNLSTVIRQRLASTMLLRRKRILYKRHRQSMLSIQTEKRHLEKTTILRGERALGSSMQPEPVTSASSQKQSATTLDPGKFQAAALSPSVISEGRTVPLYHHEALVFPPAPGYIVRKRYEQLKTRHNSDSQDLPGLESSKKGHLLEKELLKMNEITCPYCLRTLPIQEVSDNRKWQNHVRNDIDAYVCIFESCDQPDVLYSHSDEWIDHLKHHSMVWRCTTHRDLEPFKSNGEYIAHMRDIHKSKLNDKQLQALANRSSRKIHKLFHSCPLCGKNDTNMGIILEHHIAGHLRSLALISLPTHFEEADVGGSSDSGSLDVPRPQSTSTVRDISDEDNDLPLSSFEPGDPWNLERPNDAETDSLDDSYDELLNTHGAEGPNSSLCTPRFQYSTIDPEDDPIIQSILRFRRSEAVTTKENLDRESMVLKDQGSKFNPDPGAFKGKDIEIPSYYQLQDLKPAESSTIGPLSSATDLPEATGSGSRLPPPSSNAVVENRIKSIKGKEQAERVLTTSQINNSSTKRRTEGGTKTIYAQSGYKTSKAVQSDHEITLNGPIEVVGSVKCGSGIHLNGDVIVREKVDAYGHLGLNGSIRCDGRVKAYGNILVNGYIVINDKMKGCGKLRVLGTLEVTELEIYGNISITGYLKCRRLIVYGSLTLIGSESAYYVEESEQIGGDVMMKEVETEWDW